MQTVPSTALEAPPRRCFFHSFVPVKGKVQPYTDCLECRSRCKSIFSDLTDEEMNVLCAHKGENIYRKGQTIFYEGTRPTGLYILRKGKVKVFKKGLWGREQIVRLAKEGDLLTYRALGSVSHYVVSAEAIEDSVVCFIDMEDYRKVLKGSHGLALRVIQILAQAFDRAENAIRDLSQKSVRQRLAETLLQLRRQYDVDEDGAIAVRMTREDLANVVGTAVETVVRFLSEFKGKKMIAVRGQKISILDEERLQRTAFPDGTRLPEGCSSE